LIDNTPGKGGFSKCEGGSASTWLTARILQGLAALGWCRHPRFEEALAWLEDGDGRHPAGGWRAADGNRRSAECSVTAVAVLDTLTICDDERRRALRDRSVQSLLRTLGDRDRRQSAYGHPCLGRTDDAEVLSVLARAATPVAAPLVSALRGVQLRQDEGGRWLRMIAIPKTLPVPSETDLDRPSRWVTLKCVTALMAYSVDAKLPRMYPQKPAASATLPPRRH